MDFKIIEKAIKEKLPLNIAKENLNLEIEQQNKEKREQEEYQKSLNKLGIEVLYERLEN